MTPPYILPEMRTGKRRVLSQIQVAVIDVHRFLLGFRVAPYSVTESTTRRLEPLTVAEKRGGELL
jgi:hypothetical protein